MRHDLVTQRKSLLTGFGTLAGIVIALFFIASASEGGSGFHTGLFMNILLIGGYVVSSVAFSELQDTKTGIHYMMLPGSTLEKYLAKLLLTSVGWVAAALLVYMLASAVAAALASIFFAQTPGYFLPIGRTIWNGIASYLVTQSIFLFASVYFRKVAFLKVALSAFVVAATLGIIYVLTARLLFAPVFTDMFGGPEASRILVEDLRLSTVQARSFLRTLEVVGDIFTWAVVPIFFWVAGVLRLRETEV
jgi:hypothetical protein